MPTAYGRLVTARARLWPPTWLYTNRLDSSTAKEKIWVLYWAVCGAGLRGTEGFVGESAVREFAGSHFGLTAQEQVASSDFSAGAQTPQLHAPHGDSVFEELRQTLTWSYASMPSVSSSTRWCSEPSGAFMRWGEDHIHSPLVQGRCVAPTWGVATGSGRREACPSRVLLSCTC